MKTVEIMTPPTTLEAVLALAEKESGVTLTKSGRPVAQVLPVVQTYQPRRAPLHPGAIEASEDFDQPLPDEFWLGKQ